MPPPPRNRFAISYEAPNTRCETLLEVIREAAKLVHPEKRQNALNPRDGGRRERIRFRERSPHVNAPAMWLRIAIQGSSRLRSSFPVRVAHLPWRPIPWPIHPPGRSGGIRTYESNQHIVRCMLGIEKPVRTEFLRIAF